MVEEAIEEQPHILPWMRGFLLLAGVYNLIWGIFIINLSDTFFLWLSGTQRATPALVYYQGWGVLLFGFLYAASGIWIKKLWWVPGLGMISKLFGAWAVYAFIFDGDISRKFYFHLIMNDLVWVLPLGYIAYKAYLYRHSSNPL